MTCLTSRPLKSGTLGNRRHNAVNATRTPALSAVDSRGFNVRQVQYCRLPGATHSQLRIHRQHVDGAGQVLSEHDPRLGTSPSQTNVYSLSGARLLSRNVDAGWQLRLLGEARQVLQTWDQVKGFAVPTSAVVKSASNQDMLWVHTGAETFVPRTVRVAPLSGSTVSVTDGLKAGDRVVTQGAPLINQVR